MDNIGSANIREETLRYLGHRGQVLDERMLALLDDSIRDVKAAARPKYCHRTFFLRFHGDSAELSDSGLSLTGKDITRHLHGCTRCVLMAATLGVEADRLIRRFESADLSRSLIMDAAAAALIEEVCDRCEAEVREAAVRDGWQVGGRFSPGYGDLPLSTQGALIYLLDAGRKIGLHCTEMSLLLPRKSVTAVLGVWDGEVPKEQSTDRCDMCNRRGSCDYEKGECTHGYSGIYSEQSPTA